MPILYLDEDVNSDLEALVAAPNRLVRSVGSEGRLSALDTFQLIFAAEQNWTVVTCNRRDYHLLHDAWLLWSHRWSVPLMATAIDDFLDDAPVLTIGVYA